MNVFSFKMLNRIEKEGEKKTKLNDENVKTYKIIVLMHLCEEVIHKTIQFNSIH